MLVLCQGAALAQDPGVNRSPVDVLLRAAVDRTLRNRQKALAFTYQIDYRNKNFSMSGQLLADYSAKYEVVFVAGLPFRKQTEENNRPLTGKALESEQKRYDQAFDERSRMSLDQKRDYLRRERNLDIPMQLLPDLFTCKITGTERVESRPAFVIACDPRQDLRLSDEEQQRAVRKRVTLWVDQQDLVVSRLDAVLVGDDASLRKGSAASIEFSRIDGIWVPKRTDVQFTTKAGMEVVRGNTEEENSQFHRFRVDVRLLDGSEFASDPVGQGH